MYHQFRSCISLKAGRYFHTFSTLSLPLLSPVRWALMLFLLPLYQMLFFWCQNLHTLLVALWDRQLQGTIAVWFWYSKTVLICTFWGLGALRSNVRMTVRFKEWCCNPSIYMLVGMGWNISSALEKVCTSVTAVSALLWCWICVIHSPGLLPAVSEGKCCCWVYWPWVAVSHLNFGQNLFSAVCWIWVYAAAEVLRRQSRVWLCVV